MLNKEIYRLYYEKKMSASQVGQVVGIGKDAVLVRLRKMKGPRTIQESTILRTSPEYREKIRQTKIGDRNHQAKLTESDVLEIRQRYEELIISNTKTQSQHMLARRYGVKRPTISDIVLRKTWKHI